MPRPQLFRGIFGERGRFSSFGWSAICKVSRPMSATYPTKLLLAFRSGDRCAFLGCSKQLTVDAPSGGDAVVVGEAAHIAGEKPEAPRYIATMSDEERNHYDNLIYLCGDHHTQIDKQHSHFPIP